jgi:HD-GYP domain-containing protein (c-di-GMP phosphodiesterase class II)
MLLDQERKELFIKGAYGLEEQVVARTRVEVGSGIAGKVAETGDPLLVRDIEKSGYKDAPNHPQYETKSFLSVPLMIGSTVIGVINVNNKTDNTSFTEEDLSLLISLSERLSKVIERFRTTEDSLAYLCETIRSLHSMLASCERDPEGMTRNIVRWSVEVSRKLGLNDKEVQVIQYVSSVHDVGMTCVSDRILQKTLELTPEEIEEIHKHPQAGEAIIRPFEFVEMVSQSILFHHERMDGKGYPMGLKGDQIPIGARILAVLDAYVSMTSERPFRTRMSSIEAVNELLKFSGTQFDPKVLAAFIEVLMDEGFVDVEEYTKVTEGLRYSGTRHMIH